MELHPLRSRNQQHLSKMKVTIFNCFTMHHLEFFVTFTSEKKYWKFVHLHINNCGEVPRFLQAVESSILHQLTHNFIGHLISPLIDDRHIDVINENCHLLASWGAICGSNSLVYVTFHRPLHYSEKRILLVMNTDSSPFMQEQVRNSNILQCAASSTSDNDFSNQTCHNCLAYYFSLNKQEEQVLKWPILTTLFHNFIFISLKHYTCKQN